MFKNPLNLPLILIFSILGLLLMLLITFRLPSAKKKTSQNLIYLLVGGILLGIVGLAADEINNLYLFYILVMVWNLILGGVHYYLSGKLLEWPKNEPIGWSILLSLATVLIGYSALLSFIKMGDWRLPNYFVFYHMSATLTFLIPLFLMFAIECYLAIPEKIFLQKPWIYRQGGELEWDPNQVTQFILLRYQLAPQTGSQPIESLPMIAPQDFRLGDYFNSTLEYYKVTQDQYDIEVRDRSNIPLGWYFFLSDGSPTGRFLDPNKTFVELGLKNVIYFGMSNESEMQQIINRHDREGKSYMIICKREAEYKAQILKA